MGLQHDVIFPFATSLFTSIVPIESFIIVDGISDDVPGINVIFAVRCMFVCHSLYHFIMDCIVVIVWVYYVRWY